MKEMAPRARHLTPLEAIRFGETIAAWWAPAPTPPKASRRRPTSPPTAGADARAYGPLIRDVGQGRARSRYCWKNLQMTSVALISNVDGPVMDAAPRSVLPGQAWPPPRTM